MIKVVGFDADDTLWHNGPLYELTKERFIDLLRPYHDPSFVEEQLYDIDIRNLPYFGYGIKGYLLSLIEGAIDLTEGKISADEIQGMIQSTRQLMEAPLELLPEVEYVLGELQEKYALFLITKGDLFMQEKKIKRSGLANYFKRWEVVSNKNPQSYHRILNQEAVSPEHFMMVGNSIRSDVLPILELGGWGTLVPYHVVWDHESGDVDHEEGRFHQIEKLVDLPQLLHHLQ